MHLIAEQLKKSRKAEAEYFMLYNEMDLYIEHMRQ